MKQLSLSVTALPFGTIPYMVGQPNASNKAPTRRASRFIASSCGDTSQLDAGPDGGSNGGAHPQ
jgi:hypothetical protein